MAPRAIVPESGAWVLQGSTSIIIAEADEEIVGEALTLAWQNRAVAAVKRAAQARRPDAASSGVTKSRRTAPRSASPKPKATVRKKTAAPKKTTPARGGPAASVRARKKK